MKADDFKLIINAIKSGKCLAFLGAGACTSFLDKEGKEVPGLPTGSELAKWLASECDYSNGKIFDLAKVAEHFIDQNNYDREKLISLIQTKIKLCEPRPIHTVLAQLKEIKIIITSNYDNILDYELEKCGRKLTKDVYNLDKNKDDFDGPFYITAEDQDIVILHKMHGSIDKPQGIVITQSDYIRYLVNLTNERGMPAYFRNAIPKSFLLFLGYSLEDWNFKVIWEGIISTYPNFNFRTDIKRNFAIVKESSKTQRDFWLKRNIELLEGDLTDFAIQLAEHFNLEIPQLGIAKKPEGGTHE